jgi:hypothetical protein
MFCSNCQTGKKKLLTVQSVQLLTWQGLTYDDDDVAGPYTDMAGLSWQIVGSWVVESFLDTWHVFGKWDGATWPRHGLPRGTVFGLVVQNYMESMGIEPWTSRQGGVPSHGVGYQ